MKEGDALEKAVATHGGIAPSIFEPERRVVAHMPVDVRSASLAVIAVLLSIFALKWAAPVFIPLMIGVMCSYALAPIVTAMYRWRIPRPIGAAVLMIGVVAGMGWTGYTLREEANSLIEALPDAARKIRNVVRVSSSNPAAGQLDKVQKAATQLEQVAAPDPTPRGVQRVRIEKPPFNLKDYLFAGTMHMAQALGQFTAVCFLTYFLLASGDTFKRKLAKIAGPTFSKRRVTVQVLHEINEQIQRYLLVQVLTSMLVGVATAAAFWALGLNNAAVWGILAGVLNLIPYIGAVVICAASATVALLQFGRMDMALWVAGVSIVLHVVSGNIITPWLTSRASRLNTVVVFVGVLAWGWLWGVWGLLLGTPILMAVKAVCDRVEDLKPVGELLGGVEHPKDAALHEVAAQPVAEEQSDSPPTERQPADAA